MRLFLSSYRFGAHQDLLLGLLGDRPRTAAVIANAADAWPPSARASAVVSDMTPLRRLGFTAREIDLREYVGKADHLASTLADFSLVWVRGGNSFVLRAQLARSGADTALSDLLSRDALVYAGYSAGACVMTPTLRGLETLDDPGEVLPTCGVDPIWDGLGLVHKPIVPHWRSAMSDSGEIDTAVQNFASLGIDIWALTDEQAVVVDGDSIVVH